MKREDIKINKYYYITGTYHTGIVKVLDVYKNNFEYTSVIQYRTLDGEVGYTKCINAQREIEGKGELLMEML